LPHVSHIANETNCDETNFFFNYLKEIEEIRQMKKNKWCLYHFNLYNKTKLVLRDRKCDKNKIGATAELQSKKIRRNEELDKIYFSKDNLGKNIYFLNNYFPIRNKIKKISFIKLKEIPVPSSRLRLQNLNNKN